MKSPTIEDIFIDYYKVLEVPYTASLKEITGAYRSLALRYHPDKTQGEDYTEKFHLLKSAYDILSNEDSRRAFDEKLLLIRNRSAQKAALSAERKNLHEALLQKERDSRRRKEELEAAERNRVKELEIQRKAYINNLNNKATYNESLNSKVQESLRNRSTFKVFDDPGITLEEHEVTAEELSILEERVFSKLRGM